MKTLISSLLALWFGLVLFLGAQGAFFRSPETPPLPILLGFAVPLIGFAAWYGGSTAFRRTVLGADLRLLTATQAWRAGGLGFLALSAQGLLPGQFAWPAGLGDIAIGVTAPWVMLALVHRAGFAQSGLFKIWNLLGILDLLVAVTIGALRSGFVPALAGNVTTAPMSQLPLVIIPAYLVPLFIMLHVTALLQARRQYAAENSMGTA